MIQGHAEFYLFAVYSALIWVIWVIKVVVSRRYRPYAGAVCGVDECGGSRGGRASGPVP